MGERPDQGIDTSTIVWEDGVVTHDSEAFPALETVERHGATVRAYADRPSSVDTLLRDAVTSVPDRDAVVFPGHGSEEGTGETATDDSEPGLRLTYAELDDRVDRIAGGLAARGVGPGDVVALMLTNRPAFVETFFAVVRRGATAAAVNTRLSSRELGYLLEETAPDCVVTERAFLDRFDEAGQSPEYVVDEAGGGYDDLLAGEPVETPPIDEDDTAALLYTSGTTGHPKGCRASHFALVNGALNYRTSFATREGLRSLVTIPLFHVAGLVANLLHTVGCHGTTVVLDGPGPETFLETLATERIEYLLGVPTNYTLAVGRGDPSAYDLSALAIAAYGGAPMPAEMVARLRRGFPDAALCDAYGTTETVGGLVTMCPDQYSDDHAHTIGLPTPPMELAVVDDDREPLGPERVGELAIRGPIVVDGYHERPEANAETFADGWYYTGDLATISEEGFVELKGRDRDKIVRGGENIYALDVEEVLVAHEGVLEASVTSFPDEVLGERVLAAVVPKDGYRLTEDALAAHCRRELADYKIPEVVRILDELPKNAGGKVIKTELVPKPLRFGIRAGDPDDV